MAKSNAERIEAGQVYCRTIIEMMGAPKEHIEKTLRDYVAKLKEDQDLTIDFEEYSSAEKAEDSEFFSNFVELRIWFKNIERVMKFSFFSMPSSIEIIEPEQFAFNSAVFSGYLNDIQARLHEVDMTVKQLRARNKIINDNAMKLVKNLIVIGLSSGQKDVSEIEKLTGVPSNLLTEILDELVQKQVVTISGNHYVLIAQKQ